ncbi:Hypothetical protein, putative [Bodo saltans]|uniref:Uncharacterized protein n=1 Tax=Bodo saltans TaxID=75058 RepID=A0A0S4JCM0_BODSA|nr:Hypothetical protein, putative [Bodo saltans]|eukprot:CUG86918.1 Hypothetical protein, putative [Bodo saltans]
MKSVQNHHYFQVPQSRPTSGHGGGYQQAQHQNPSSSSSIVGMPPAFPGHLHDASVSTFPPPMRLANHNTSIQQTTNVSQFRDVAPPHGGQQQIPSKSNASSIGVIERCENDANTHHQLQSHREGEVVDAEWWRGPVYHHQSLLRSSVSHPHSNPAHLRPDAALAGQPQLYNYIGSPSKQQQGQQQQQSGRLGSPYRGGGGGRGDYLHDSYIPSANVAAGSGIAAVSVASNRRWFEVGLDAASRVRPPPVPQLLHSAPIVGDSASLLSAIQIQVSMLMEHSHETMRHSLQDFRRSVGESLGSLENRVTTLEASCAKVHGVVNRELSEARDERNALSAKLMAIQEARDTAALEMRGGGSAAAGGVNRVTSPSPASPQATSGTVGPNAKPVAAALAAPPSSTAVAESPSQGAAMRNLLAKISGPTTAVPVVGAPPSGNAASAFGGPNSNVAATTGTSAPAQQTLQGSAVVPGTVPPSITPSTQPGATGTPSPAQQQAALPPSAAAAPAVSAAAPASASSAAPPVALASRGSLSRVSTLMSTLSRLNSVVGSNSPVPQTSTPTPAAAGTTTVSTAATTGATAPPAAQSAAPAAVPPVAQGAPLESGGSAAAKLQSILSQTSALNPPAAASATVSLPPSTAAPPPATTLASSAGSAQPPAAPASTTNSAPQATVNVAPSSVAALDEKPSRGPAPTGAPPATSSVPPPPTNANAPPSAPSQQLPQSTTSTTQPPSGNSAAPTSLAPPAVTAAQPSLTRAVSPPPRGNDTLMPTMVGTPKEATDGLKAIGRPGALFQEVVKTK